MGQKTWFLNQKKLEKIIVDPGSWHLHTHELHLCHLWFHQQISKVSKIWGIRKRYSISLHQAVETEDKRDKAESEFIQHNDRVEGKAQSKKCEGMGRSDKQRFCNVNHI